MTNKDFSQRRDKDGGKATPVSSAGQAASQPGTRGTRPVHETVALSNKLFFQTAVVRYGSWERFLEKNGAPTETDEKE